MTRTVPANPPSPQPAAPRPVRVSQDLFHAAAARLVSQLGPDIDLAAKRLVSIAPSHGIDLSLAWATLDPGGSRVRQVCLGVPGSGRTAMLFISEPGPEGDPGGPNAALAERVACIHEVCAHFARDAGGRVRLAQALPDPGERWTIDALGAAGFTKVGDLAYLRRPAMPVPGEHDADPAWPDGLTLTRFDQLAGERDATLIRALERTYIDTLDCPELCGLRAARDVLASHRATGVFDPALWWVLLDEGRPEGCVLLNRCPEQRTVELVYLGLGPTLRGSGLAGKLLCFSLARGRAANPGWTTTCAVDERNAPALKLYRALSFEAFARRVALVRPVEKA